MKHPHLWTTIEGDWIAYLARIVGIGCLLISGALAGMAWG